MKNRLPYLSFAVVVGGIAVLLAGTAQSQVGPPKAYVTLQPAAPGTSQSGNANVSGRITSSQLVTGSFTLSGGTAGKVLTSNGSGVGTWQTPSLIAPFAIQGNSAQATFLATNAALGDAVDGYVTASGAVGVRGTTAHATQGYGVVGEAFGTNSVGVLGWNGISSGIGKGVEGTSFSSSGYGVFATNMASGIGVQGRSAIDGIGVYGVVDGNGFGVSGDALGSSGTGVWARGATGLYATSSSSGYAAHLAGIVRIDGNVGLGSLPGSERLRVFGNTADVQSITNTGGGRGLFVQTNSDTGIWSITGTGFAGIDGRTGSSSGYGVFGSNTNGAGTGTGVVGQTATGAGFGVYSIGNMGASGVKPFRIDHPLDPENKYLLHYAAESPSPQNFYSGNVTTDRNGKAWVELPDYFAEINANFKYQLTVLDDSESEGFVQVKVGRKIQGNRFLIMTSAPNVEVSWRIEADRNDRWVQQNGAPTEREKPESIKGTYQHPELYGQPKERGETFLLSKPKVKK